MRMHATPLRRWTCSWERLSKSEDTGRNAKKEKHGSISDKKNCTFKPKITKWKGGETKEADEDDEKPDRTEMILQFVKRQDASTRSDRTSKDYAQKKRDYNLRLDRLQCRSCGSFQSYDEFLEKRMKCPADFCEHGEFYQPQVVFNRDVLNSYKQMIRSACSAKGETNLEQIRVIEEKMKSLEPSEKAIVQRLLREALDKNMTEEQRLERKAKASYDKQKQMTQDKERQEMKIKMIEETRKKQAEKIAAVNKAEQKKGATSLRKVRVAHRLPTLKSFAVLLICSSRVFFFFVIQHRALTTTLVLASADAAQVYDKESGQVITVEYNYEQPICKYLPAKSELKDPDNPDSVIEFETVSKVPYYDDESRRYWDGPIELEDEGRAHYTKKDFFLRLEEDNERRKVNNNAAADKHLGKFGTIYKAKNLKKQLNKESSVNEELAQAVEDRDLMGLRRSIHKAGTLNTALVSEELKLAVKTERDLCQELKLLKEGKEAVAKEDMDGVNDWLKKVKSGHKKKLNAIKFKLRRLEKVENHIKETKEKDDPRNEDPRFDDWLEKVEKRREILENERDAAEANSEKSEEVEKMQEDLESSKAVMDKLKSAMRELNLEDVSELLEEAINMHSVSDDAEKAERARENFFLRLKKDVSKLHKRLWDEATVLKNRKSKGYQHYSGEGNIEEDLYDIEFADGSVMTRVKRGMLKSAAPGDNDYDSDDDGESKEEEESDEESGGTMDSHFKPKRKIFRPQLFSIKSKVLVRRAENYPAPNKYSIFRKDDLKCAPVTIRKLNRRINAIKNFLNGTSKFPKNARKKAWRESYMKASAEDDDEEKEKILRRFLESPLRPLLWAYEKQKRELVAAMKHSNMEADMKELEEEKGAGSDSEDDEDY